MSSLVSLRSWETGTSPTGPVMILLHGYGSNERDLPGLTPLLPALPWASVRAPLPMPGAGAAWFPLADIEHIDEGPIADSTAALWEWVDEALPENTPLVPVGFSQGGLMALQLLRTRPERVATTVVLAGLAARREQVADAVLTQSRPPVFWARGLADPIIPESAVHHLEGFLPTIASATARVYPGLGHSVNEAMMRDVREFLSDTLPSQE